MHDVRANGYRMKSAFFVSPEPGRLVERDSRT